MSEGTLYHYTGARSTPTALVARRLGLPFSVSGPGDAFKGNFAAHKVPVRLFSGFKKEKLQEVVAILLYFAELVKEKTNGKTLLSGSDALETAQVLEWTSLATTNFASSVFPATLHAIPHSLVKYTKEEAARYL